MPRHPRPRALASAAAVATLVALPAVAVAGAAVVSNTVSDPTGDVAFIGTGETQFPPRSVDINQVTFSSDDSTGTRQLYVKIRMRNVIPRATDWQSFALATRRGDDTPKFFFDRAYGGRLDGCADSNITANPDSDFIAIRFAASCVPGSAGALKVSVVTYYNTPRTARASDGVGYFGLR